MQFIKRYIEIFWLPTVLAVLLAAETNFFNVWLNISVAYYFPRLVAASIGLSIVLFFPAVFFAKRTTRYIYLFAASIIVSLIFVSEFLYYKYSSGFLEASSLGYANQATTLFGTVKTLLTPQILLFVLPLLIVIAGYFFVIKGQRESKLFFKEKITVIFLMIIIFCLGYGTLLKEEELDSGDLGRLYNDTEMYNLSTLVGKAGIINFYLESLVEYVVEPETASLEDREFLETFAKSRTLPAQAADFGQFQGKNLIFIQVESLENWEIGYKINGAYVAPNLTALSKQGKYFTNYYSQIGVGNTADAEFSTLNSLYPLPDSVAFITHAANKSDALPRLLDNNGYNSAVMHGDVATFWNRSNAYPPIGYEKQISQDSYTISRPVGFENLGDADFFKQSLPKLEALKQPFMATLITLSTHTPFTLPSDLETLTVPQNTDLTPTEQQYLEAVHYSDAALGNFIAGLKKDGLYDNSVIFIFGDHAAFIGTGDSQTEHVPLIVLTPDNSFKGIETEPASHLDLYPTAASLLGIQYPISALGQDLFSTKTPVVTQRVAGTGAIKFIMSSNLKYVGAADGAFEDGTCFTMPQLKSVPVTSCQVLYNEQSETIRASDIVVRYNLLSLLNTQK